MHFFCCLTTVAPLRKDAAHNSEMISQLLLGECVELKESTKDFLLVKSLYDGYEGWCQKSQLTEVDEHFYLNNHSILTAEPITQALCNGKNIFIPSGCFIGCFNEGCLTIGKTVFNFPKTPFHFNNNNNDVDIFEIIQPYINTPYLWGGKSIFGIDCSGFVQNVFKMLDFKLPRDAYQQAEVGESIGFLQETQIGDLAYFDNEQGRITHVGIILNNENIMHASGKVRIDKIDNMGIIHSETGERTHKLRLLKRVLS